tara:strand:- start:138 stop:827 length:690 start_codon:yes stop_codon:yes gene_type:complete
MCHINDFKEYQTTIATYGVLRGTFELIQKVNNFFYMDHGYFNQSKREFIDNKTNVLNMDGYFRIVFNGFIHNGEGDYPDDRLKKLNLDISAQNKLGSYVILSEPSETMKKIYNKPNWVNDTKKILKNYTDRRLIVHNKFSKQKLDDLLKNAWAFVSLQSTAGFNAMRKGIPAYFTDHSLNNVAKIKDIESPKINYKIFNNLAYGQWTLNEISSGEAWENITKHLSQKFI